MMRHAGDAEKFRKEMIPQSDVDHVKKIFTAIEKDLKTIRLRVSLKALSTSRASVNTSSTMEEVVSKTTALRDTIVAELSTYLLVHLDPNRSKFYTTKALFGEAVTSHFPSAIDDIEEAGKCLSLDRGTASVFHLMRVMEVSLRVLGSTLKDPIDPNTNPSWERILRKSDEELRKPLADRSPEWKTDDQFFSQVTAHLRAVKDAWRNPTLHIEKKYTVEEALDVFHAVRGFMRHFASKLHE